MPMIHEMMPPRMQPATAVFGPFAEKTRAWTSRAAREGGVRCGRAVGEMWGVTQTRAWKSRAARLPKPSTKIVTQLKKIALGIGSIASGSVIWLGRVRTSPIG